MTKRKAERTGNARERKANTQKMHIEPDEEIYELWHWGTLMNSRRTLREGRGVPWLVLEHGIAQLKRVTEHMGNVRE